MTNLRKYFQLGDKKKLILTLLVMLSFIPAGGAVFAIIGLVALTELKEQERRSYQRAFSELRKENFITQVEVNGKIVYTLTDKGKKAAEVAKFSKTTINTSEKWDKKVRLVMFDISETARSVRNSFRQKLKSLNFVQLQKSIFMHPYPCKKQILDIAAFLGIKDQILIIESEEKSLIRKCQSTFAAII
ncbi:CRISPR-associated endonuclease Cas2 [Patescibacteria group bacterium]